MNFSHYEATSNVSFLEILYFFCRKHPNIELCPDILMLKPHTMSFRMICDWTRLNKNKW